MLITKLINPHISKSKTLNRNKRISNTLCMLLPILLLACLLVNVKTSLKPTPFTILNTVIFFTIVAFGLAVGYHRYFAHYTFKTSKLVRFVMGVLGTWALQGSVTSWVADHRRHHRFADRRYDPHSPYANDHGVINNRLAGWIHAHVGWMITGSVSDEQRYASDCLSDPVAQILSRYYWVIAVTGLLLPGIFGWLYNGFEEGILCIAWAGCVRTILVHQLAWSANSFGHIFGDKIEGALDESRNNVFLGMILLGEGLHSFHHQYPTLAMNEPAKFDAFGHSLVFFERFGLVWDLRKAKPVPVVTTAQPQQTALQGAGTI